jgi:M6 family metalloprotease-like protein
MKACLPLSGSRTLRAITLLITTAALLSVMPASPAAAASRASRADGVFQHGDRRAPGLNQPEADPPYRKRLAPKPSTGSPNGRSSARAVATQMSMISGTAWLPVILADFSDNTAEAALHSPAAFADMLLQDGYPHGAGSLRDFYQDQSGGLFDVTGAVTRWLRMPKSYSTYVGTDAGRQAAEPNVRTFVRDAVVAADATTDFCKGDTNGDGYVDSVVVVHAGAGAEEGGVTSRLWSVKWSLPSSYTTKDVCSNGLAVKVWKFTVQPEELVNASRSAPGAPDRLIAIGVFCHELGHILGLPDLHDTDSSSSGGVGGWDLMANGSWGVAGNRPWRPTPFGAWSRTQLGWAVPTNVTQPIARASIPSIDGPHAGQATGVYRLAKDGSTSAQEYFLVENRQPVGFAADFPGGGLAIWRIDDSVSGNSNDARRQVSLLQADGLDELGGPSGAQPDAGDLYPGLAVNRALTGGTNPHTRTYDGGETGVGVKNIGDPSQTVVADFVVTVPPPPPPPPPPVPNVSVTVQAPGSAFVGDNSAYSVTVANRDAPAKAVSLTLTLPPGAVLVSTSGSSCSGTAPVTCTLGNLDAGSSRSVSLIASPTRAGTARLTAEARSNPADGTSGDNVTNADVATGGKTCTWVGTMGNDTFAGSSGNDVLCGLGGNDTLGGGGGADTIYGGTGDDSLAGGSSDDVLDGGDGIDTATYATGPAVNANLAYSPTEGRATGDGTDRLVRTENLTGSASSDVIVGSEGANVLSGGSGDDTIRGGGGNDTIVGYDGNDWLYGEAGDDVISGLGGIDFLDGGSGANDACSQGEAVPLLVTNCEG